MSPAVERLRGYRETLRRHDLSSPETMIVARERVEELGDEAGFHAMQELLKLRRRPDAVFCYNDLTAIGATEAARVAGLSVPGDIAFVGTGNLRYAKYLRMPLTSVDQQPESLGAASRRTSARSDGQTRYAMQDRSVAAEASGTTLER